MPPGWVFDSLIEDEQPCRGGAYYVSGASIISKPNLVPIQKYTRVQRVEGQPENCVSELTTDSRWEAICRTAGKASYDVTFAVIEAGGQESTGVRGYYRWSPTIEITSSP